MSSSSPSVSSPSVSSPSVHRHEEKRAAMDRGRILRLKLGFNPNSSSIGTIVFAMPAAMIGLTVAFGAAAALT